MSRTPLSIIYRTPRSLVSPGMYLGPSPISSLVFIYLPSPLPDICCHAYSNLPRLVHDESSYPFFPLWFPTRFTLHSTIGYMDGGSSLPSFLLQASSLDCFGYFVY